MSSPQRQGSSADLAVVTGLKSGDQGAMAELYDRYSSVVYAVALRVLGDTGAAEDVLQEVFLAVVAQAQRIRRGTRQFGKLAGRDHTQPSD